MYHNVVIAYNYKYNKKFYKVVFYLLIAKQYYQSISHVRVDIHVGREKMTRLVGFSF